MRRLSLASAPVALALILGACGGDGGDDSDNGGDEPAATPTLSPMDAQRATITAQDQPTVPDSPLPTPTPLTDDRPVLQVVFGANTYTPIRNEFNNLPTVEISANGKKVRGVSLAAIAEKAQAPASATVTIQGTRVDNLRLGAIRFSLTEIGTNTVLVLDDAGHVSLASSYIPPEQWLNTITGIALN